MKDISLITFHDTFRSLFYKLPNPFEPNSEYNDELYQIFYLTYVLESFRGGEASAFITKYDAHINNQVLFRVFLQEIFGYYKGKKPNDNYVYLMWRKCKVIMEQ